MRCRSPPEGPPRRCLDPTISVSPSAVGCGGEDIKDPYGINLRSPCPSCTPYPPLSKLRQSTKFIRSLRLLQLGQAWLIPEGGGGYCASLSVLHCPLSPKSASLESHESPCCVAWKKGGGVSGRRLPNDCEVGVHDTPPHTMAVQQKQKAPRCRRGNRKSHASVMSGWLMLLRGGLWMADVIAWWALDG